MAFVNSFELTDLQLFDTIMSDISERCWHAGWMQDTEFVLWQAVFDGLRHWGQCDITEDDIESLRALSERTEGWMVFDDDTGAPIHMPLDRWTDAYAAWRK